MELKIKEKPLFHESLEVYGEDLEKYIFEFATLIQKKKSKSEVVEAVWKKMEKNEKFARVGLYILFHACSDMIGKRQKVKRTIN